MMEPLLTQIVKGPGESLRWRRISDLLTQLCVHVFCVSFTHACSPHQQDTHEERKEQQQPLDSPVMTCDTLWVRVEITGEEWSAGSVLGALS